MCERRWEVMNPSGVFHALSKKNGRWCLIHTSGLGQSQAPAKVPLFYDATPPMQEHQEGVEPSTC